MITGAQIRAGRNLMGWDLAKLAFLARMPVSSLVRAEGADGQPAITEREGAALERVLSSAGVEFTSQEGSAPGVRLRG